MPEPIPVDLLDVIAFVRVVETGSIANAAARLGIAKSIVSRRVSRLEAVLGAQLLDLHAEGHEVDRYWSRISCPCGRRPIATRMGAGGRQQVDQRDFWPAANRSSRLWRVSAGAATGGIRASLSAYPVRCSLYRSSGGHGREAYYLAISPGAVRTRPITRKFAKVRWAVVASPAYLDARGRPAAPANLAAHDTILYALDAGRWRFQGPKTGSTCDEFPVFAPITGKCSWPLRVQVRGLYLFNVHGRRPVGASESKRSCPISRTRGATCRSSCRLRAPVSRVCGIGGFPLREVRPGNLSRSPGQGNLQAAKTSSAPPIAIAASAAVTPRPGRGGRQPPSLDAPWGPPAAAKGPRALT